MLTRRFECTTPPLEEAALGLKEAILLYGEMGFSNVHIELDCRLEPTARRNLATSCQLVDHF